MIWFLFSGVEWGLVFPDANGEYQSPINLNSREAKYDPKLLEVRLSPNYVVCRDCEVINDGHSVQILLKSKSGMLSHYLWVLKRMCLDYHHSISSSSSTIVVVAEIQYLE